MEKEPHPAPDWRAAIDEGTQALREARIAEALAAFQRASHLEPASAIPHLYLGIVWLQQCVFGASSPENDAYLYRARAELSQGLEADPKDWKGLVMLAQLALWEQQFSEARTLLERALEVKPRDAGIWYTLGVVAWKQWSLDKTAAARSVLDDGIVDLNQALSLDPEHPEAMQYLALFLRERVNLSNDPGARRADIVAAHKLKQRCEEAKGRRRQGEVIPNELDAMLEMWARGAIYPPPPPPAPPPPRDPSEWRESKSQGSPSIRIDPTRATK